MQNHDEIKETSTPAADITNKSESKVWERRIAIVGIIAASIGLLVCAGLLIQAYMTHKPAFELLAFSSFNQKFELMRYYSFMFNIAGYLVLIITLSISLLVERQRKKLSYISAFIGAVLLFFSFGLSLAYHQPGLEWWGYFYTVASGMGLVTITFSKLVGREQKRLLSILDFLTCVLMFATFLLIFLEVRQ